MNKSLLVLLAIFGGIEVVFYIITPMLLGIVWLSISDLNYWANYILFGAGLCATLFRAIKVGFLKNQNEWNKNNRNKPFNEEGRDL